MEIIVIGNIKNFKRKNYQDGLMMYCKLLLTSSMLVSTLFSNSQDD